jgi:hypothetical protein
MNKRSQDEKQLRVIVEVTNLYIPFEHMPKEPDHQEEEDTSR